jgi:hypothetical protein
LKGSLESWKEVLEKAQNDEDEEFKSMMDEWLAGHASQPSAPNHERTPPPSSATNASVQPSTEEPEEVESVASDGPLKGETEAVYSAPPGSPSAGESANAASIASHRSSTGKIGEVKSVASDDESIATLGLDIPLAYDVFNRTKSKVGHLSERSKSYDSRLQSLYAAFLEVNPTLFGRTGSQNAKDFFAFLDKAYFHAAHERYCQESGKPTGSDEANLTAVQRDPEAFKTWVLNRLRTNPDAKVRIRPDEVEGIRAELI